MKKIRTKLLLIFGILLLLVIASFIFSNTINSIHSNEQQINQYKESLFNSYNNLIKSQTESAVKLLEYAYQQYESGAMTEEEAKQLGQTLIKQLRYGENGYFWIHHTDGTLIAHPEQSQNEGSNQLHLQDPDGTYVIRHLIEAATKGENDGFTEYLGEKPGEEGTFLIRAYSQYFEPWNYIVSTGNFIDNLEAQLEAKKEELTDQLTEQIVIQIFILTCLVMVYCEVAYYFSERLSKNIQAIGTNLQEIANQNLTVEPLQLKTKDEVGQLSRNVNFMVDHIKSIISKIASTAQSLYNHSSELSHTSNEVFESSEQISATMQNIAEGSESQAQHISELAQTVADFNKTMRETNQRAEEIHKATYQIVELTNNGDQHMKASIEQMNKIDYVMNQSLQKVKDLDNQTREISILVSIIKEIAEQTNLLALNAAIEAARAGEQGKGFAVVAEEVRKLADQVSKSVQNITSIVSTIQQESTVVMNYLRDGYNEVTRGSSQILQTGEIFSKINHSIEQMSENLSFMSTSIHEMTMRSDSIKYSIENVAAITEETTAGIEQTTSTLQLTSSRMNDIAENAKELEHISEELKEIVQQFKI